MRVVIAGVRGRRLIRGLSLGAIALVASAANGQARPQGLKALFDQFQSLSSLYFSATADIIAFPWAGCDVTIPDDPDEPQRDGGDDVQKFPGVIEGYLEYGAEGDRYFIKSWAEPDKYPGIQTEVAYDGRRFQILMAQGTLLERAFDSNVILPVLPNPLFELLQFRYPLTDHNYETRLQFKDILRDHVPPEFWAVEWQKVEESGRVLERAIFPGGTYEGTSYVHHIFVPQGWRNRPVRIDRVAAQGRVTSTEFSDYRRIDTPNGVAYWPHKIDLRAFDNAGETREFISYVLTQLAVDADVPDELFKIPADRALRVWDDEEGRFREKPVE